MLSITEFHLLEIEIWTEAEAEEEVKVEEEEFNSLNDNVISFYEMELVGLEISAISCM